MRRGGALLEKKIGKAARKDAKKTASMEKEALKAIQAVIGSVAETTVITHDASFETTTHTPP